MTSTLAGSGSIEGGFGSDCVTITDAGIISVNGTSTLTGSISIGGGSGDTGATITDTGIISADGTPTLAGSMRLELALQEVALEIWV